MLTWASLWAFRPLAVARDAVLGVCASCTFYETSCGWPEDWLRSSAQKTLLWQICIRAVLQALNSSRMAMTYMMWLCKKNWISPCISTRGWFCLRLRHFTFNRLMKAAVSSCSSTTLPTWLDAAIVCYSSFSLRSSQASSKSWKLLMGFFFELKNLWFLFLAFSILYISFR